MFIDTNEEIIEKILNKICENIDDDNEFSLALLYAYESECKQKLKEKLKKESRFNKLIKAYQISMGTIGVLLGIIFAGLNSLPLAILSVVLATLEISLPDIYFHNLAAQTYNKKVRELEAIVDTENVETKEEVLEVTKTQEREIQDAFIANINKDMAKILDLKYPGYENAIRILYLTAVSYLYFRKQENAKNPADVLARHAEISSIVLSVEENIMGYIKPKEEGQLERVEDIAPIEIPNAYLTEEYLESFPAIRQLLKK